MLISRQDIPLRLGRGFLPREGSPICLRVHVLGTCFTSYFTCFRYVNCGSGRVQVSGDTVWDVLDSVDIDP
jgi:hypothetical protein